MTEREEDEELLLGEKDDIEESSNITHFSESPYCESSVREGGRGVPVVQRAGTNSVWRGCGRGEEGEGCWWFHVQWCTVAEVQVGALRSNNSYPCYLVCHHDNPPCLIFTFLIDAFQEEDSCDCCTCHLSPPSPSPLTLPPPSLTLPSLPPLPLPPSLPPPSLPPPPLPPSPLDV